MDDKTMTVAKWVMRYLWAILAFVVAFMIVGYFLLFRPAHAADVDMRFNRQTCYSWEGGHKSAGSFSQCDAPIVVVQVPGKEVVKETVRVERVEVPTAVPCVPPPKPAVTKTKPKQRYTCDGKWVPVK